VASCPTSTELRLQAIKFGARLSVATPATRLAFEDGRAAFHLDGVEIVAAQGPSIG
jgi:hypothetical protein